ncbi:MAG: hypothetical protein AAGI07_12810, partial [Bacteroidota bacterium]
NSTADEYSPLSGKELVEKKVKKFVVMGGKFPAGKEEWNFNGNMPNVTKDVFDKLRAPVVFLGYEIGFPIKTGKVFNTIDTNIPLYTGFMHFSQNAPWMKNNFNGEILDNASYDQTAVLFAVREGLGIFWNEVIGGYLEIDKNGDNRWIQSERGNQSYLVLKESPKEIATLIEKLMLGDF